MKLNTKTKIFIVILGLIFSPSSAAFAHCAEDSCSVDNVVAEIMLSQSVSDKKDIDCQKVTDEQFEELGDAAMDELHPGGREHELMDRMMGGEGSETLKAMHILMGENYLGCFNKNSQGFGTMGYMMNNMMGGLSNPFSLNNNNMMYNNIMGNFGIFGWFGWIFMILFWVLILLGFIALIKWLVDQLKGNDKKKKQLP